MLPISVCIITKNEEKYLETCLQKLKRYDFEIIVTDTGSTDHTVAIAGEYADQVHYFTWNNDFSAARNFCISKASNDWILNVDSDEYLTADMDNDSFCHMILSYLDHPQKAGMVDIINPHSGANGSSTSVEPVARFFHRKHYHYQGTVHEQPVCINGQKPSYVKLPLSFYHIGYSDDAVLKKKADRNIALLKKALQDTPDDPYLYFQLGQSYFVMGDMEQAAATFEEGLSFDVEPSLQYVQNMVESYGYCLLNLKQYKKALQFEAIYSAFCSHADFVFLMGLIYMNNALFDEAITQFLKATTISDFSVRGTNSYLAYYNAGVIYECTGRKKEASECYRKCGEYAPAVDALKRLP